jgi:hypothetical protein
MEKVTAIPGKSMHMQKRVLLVINLLFGPLVPISYAYGLLTHPGQGELLWGGVPLAFRQIYTASIFLATAGYFAFSGFIFLCLDPDQTKIGRGFGYGWFSAIYLAILIPSTLWMPLTFDLITDPSPDRWLVVRLMLSLVGLASIGLLASLLALQPKSPRWAYLLAITGAIAFCWQTTVLDMIIWPAYYPIP